MICYGKEVNWNFSFLEKKTNSQQNKNTQKVLETKTLLNKTGGTGSADIFKYKAVCPYLRQKEDYLPPYCKNPNNCEDIFEYAGIKYCKRELK